MTKDLIIVESPAKVRTIKKLLGRQYDVAASVGHVRDLPQRDIGVDEDKDFTPKYQVIPGKQKVVTQLKSAAAKADRVLLAPDPDREGEAIAWHVAELIKDKNDNIQRIQFNEITARAVREALEHPRELNKGLFESQQARRILDRLVGYKISPLLWKKVKSGISAGRVQSVALRLLVEREKERQAFEPQEYWLFKALLEAEGRPAFETDLHKVGGKKPDIGSEKAALALEKKALDAAFSVESVQEKQRDRQPPPPFITSTLQQAANQRLGYPAKKTMNVAQRLYEGVELGERGTVALITYMRTDSVRVAGEARDAAKAYILERFGPDFYPPKPRYYKTKSSAQDAHEAIRPVDPALAPDEFKDLLPRDQFALYRLIWERFMSSQMASAKFHDTTVTVSAADTQWRAKGERLLFPGWLAAQSSKAKNEAGELPKLSQGEPLALVKLDKEQKFTQPPARYTEATLVKELEDKGIGRPSTYAAIISTLLDRDYAELVEKNFVPTVLGITVSDLLSQHFQRLMDVGFTASMEESLDQVADGKENWVGLLRKFTEDFNPTLETAQKEMARVKAGLDTGVVCEKCGKPMVVKFGRAGSFLGCTGYPDCDNTKNFTRDDKGTVLAVDKPQEERQVVGKCPDCGNDLIIKRARTGSRFISCAGYPKCKHSEPFTTGVACPNEGCDGQLVERSSRRGKLFYSCNRYPQCDFAVWDWPIAEPCPDCGGKILVRKTTKTRGEHLACPDKKCKYWRALEQESTPDDSQ